MPDTNLLNVETVLASGALNVNLAVSVVTGAGVEYTLAAPSYAGQKKTIVNGAASANFITLTGNAGGTATALFTFDAVNGAILHLDGDVTGLLWNVSGTVGTPGKAALTFKRPVYESVDQTAEKTFTVQESGTLVRLAAEAAQIQVFNLPTIQQADIGTFFDFVVEVIGNSAAAGSYTINTGGNAADLTAAPTAGYDDFALYSRLSIMEVAIAATGDKLLVSPVDGDGAMILAANTSNALLLAGTHFRMTAVKASTTVASSDVWFIEGNLITSEATGFVTGALFTAP